MDIGNNVRLCRKCRRTPITGHRNRIYCDDCAKEVHHEQARKCSRRYRTRQKNCGTLDWVGKLSEAERIHYLDLRNLEGERFVRIANAKIQLAEKLIEAGEV